MNNLNGKERSVLCNCKNNSFKTITKTITTTITPKTTILTQQVKHKKAPERPGEGQALQWRQEEPRRKELLERKSDALLRRGTWRINIYMIYIVRRRRLSLTTIINVAGVHVRRIWKT